MSYPEVDDVAEQRDLSICNLPTIKLRSVRNPVTVMRDVVLDPFTGSGKTGVVGKKLGRNFIGIDVKEDYVEIARKQIAEVEEHSPIPRIVLEALRVPQTARVNSHFHATQA